MFVSLLRCSTKAARTMDSCTVENDTEGDSPNPGRTRSPGAGGSRRTRNLSLELRAGIVMRLFSR